MKPSGCGVWITYDGIPGLMAFFYELKDRGQVAAAVANHDQHHWQYRDKRRVQWVSRFDDSGKPIDPEDITV